MKKYLNKLKYRSWHRGTKEADIFLGNFFDLYCKNMNLDQLKKYEKFLELVNDNDIILIAKGKKTWSDGFSREITELIEEYIISENLRP